MTARQFCIIWLSALLAALAFAGPAFSHPHVWVTVKTEVLYDSSKRVTALRHQWVFDEFYSAFAAQGLDANGDGKFDRSELSALAEENVTSLQEFDYFTFVKVGGATAALAPARDYWLEHVNGVLVLNFTLPLKRAVDARKSATKISIYDPTYFVAFAFAEKDPVRLAAAAPKGCAIALVGRKPAQTETASLSESFFKSLNGSSNFGAQFAQGAAIRCHGR